MSSPIQLEQQMNPEHTKQNEMQQARQQQKQMMNEPAIDRKKLAKKDEIIQQGQEPLDCYKGCMHWCGNFNGSGKQYLPCIFCCCVSENPYEEVQQGNVGLLTRFGKYVKTQPSGTYFINPYTEKMAIIKQMIQTISLNRQVILTKDNIQATIDASVNYKIMDPIITEYTIENTNKSITHLSYSVLRAVTGQYNLQDLLEKKEEVRIEIMKQCDEQLMSWGIHIENVYIKDIIVNEVLQGALSVVAQEKRFAEGKIISAKADVESAKLLREAADALSSKSAMQIRYLMTLGKVCEDKNTKIIFYPKKKK